MFKLKSLNNSKLAPSSKYFATTTFLVCVFASLVQSQSIGYYPTANLGFNPYTSPLHGYGLGSAFGSNGVLPSASLALGGGLLAPGLGFGAAFKPHDHSLASKLHATALLAKDSLPTKLMLLKHPEYMFTPYGLDYGFGRHYGAAVVPNDPYKSSLTNNYNGGLKFNSGLSGTSPLVAQETFRKTSMLKPLVKIGAVLTAAALFAAHKMAGDVIPSRLNPAGMITNNVDSFGAQ